MSLDLLKREWLNANAAAESATRAYRAALHALRIAAIDAYPVKVGSKVSVGGKVGIVVGHEVSIWDRAGEVQVNVRPTINRIKKDGTAAANGRIFAWHNAAIEVLKQPAEDSHV